jgi:hypothetical protein
MWRAHPALTSVLTVLALFARPVPGHSWTHAAPFPAHHLAALTGVDRKTVFRALSAGAALGVLRSERVRHPAHPKLPCTAHSLSAELFAAEGETYTMIPAPLVYGGAWALLGGNNAARHLVLTVAAVDAVRWVPDYRAEVMAAAFARHGVDDPLAWIEDEAEAEHAIATARAKHPMTLRELARLAGMQPSTVLDALSPALVSGAGLLVAGPPGGARWYGHQLHRVAEYAPEELPSLLRAA